MVGGGGLLLLIKGAFSLLLGCRARQLSGGQMHRHSHKCLRVWHLRTAHLPAALLAMPGNVSPRRTPSPPPPQRLCPEAVSHPRLKPLCHLPKWAVR